MDIESIVGPTLGNLTVKLHGDASLRGTVSGGTFGTVTLDYSDYTGVPEGSSDPAEGATVVAGSSLAKDLGNMFGYGGTGSAEADSIFDSAIVSGSILRGVGLGNLGLPDLPATATAKAPDRCRRPRPWWPT